MKTTALIYVPYDSGMRGARMGAGPLRIRSAGLAERLRLTGVPVTETVLELDQDFHPEIAAAFALQSRVRGAVQCALSDCTFPCVIAGNCNTGAIGVASGIGTDDIALIWFDAHDDCETPDTSTSGFLDGMGLAALTGQCWQSLMKEAGSRTLPGERIVLIGAREVSSSAAAHLDQAGIQRCSPTEIRADLAGALEPCLSGWSKHGVKRLSVHVDLDVHDPQAVAPANSFAAPDGMLASEVREVIRLAQSRIPIVAASIASFDPSCDRHGRMLSTALELIATLRYTDAEHTSLALYESEPAPSRL